MEADTGSCCSLCSPSTHPFLLFQKSVDQYTDSLYALNRGQTEEQSWRCLQPPAELHLLQVWYSSLASIPAVSRKIVFPSTHRLYLGHITTGIQYGTRSCRSLFRWNSPVDGQRQLFCSKSYAFRCCSAIWRSLSTSLQDMLLLE